MDHNTSTASWIEEYLEWTHPEAWTSGPGSLALGANGVAQADASRQFAAAYLDWIDGRQGSSAPHDQAIASADEPAGAGGRTMGAERTRVRDEPSGLDAFRDALTVALHTEVDCIQFLRGILDAGDPRASTLRLAAECLAHAERAERLLDDERRRWRRLTAVQGPGSAPSGFSAAA